MPTKLFDQHVHSSNSVDSEASAEDAVWAALELGLGGLTFTEHFDTHPDEWGRCIYDYDSCSADVARLRESFGQRIFVGQGIEVCYQPDNLPFILDFLAGHDFDLVILSVHWAGGRQLGHPENWQGLDASTGTRLYLERVIEAARHCCDLNQRHGRRCFDVLAHLDFAKRYTERLYRQNCVGQNGQLIDDILRACLRADLVPEVNTSTMRGGNLAEPMPGPDTMRRYAALGGTAMALGSDAHLADAVGADLTEAADMLHEAGVSHQAVFRARQAELVPLRT